MTADVRHRAGGEGEPLLLLLHGMGATSDAWARCEPFLARVWPGRWLAVDLPGHGGSPPLPQYSLHNMAVRIARDLQHALDECRDLVVLGHSLGGAVGLALAGGVTETPPRLVVGLGIKTQWTEADRARARELAQRPPASFDSRDEAGSRYLRVSGLAGLVALDDPAVTAGLREEGGRWRLAMDPAAFGIAAPDMPGLLTRSRARVILARGDDDGMVTHADLAGFGVPVVTLPGAGHNAHVENPESVVRMCVEAL